MAMEDEVKLIFEQYHGKISNADLIGHFKHMFKGKDEESALAKKEFKKVVNKLAKLQADEDGTKCLVLRDRYRQELGLLADADGLSASILKAISTARLPSYDSMEEIDHLLFPEDMTKKGSNETNVPALVETAHLTDVASSIETEFPVLPGTQSLGMAMETEFPAETLPPRSGNGEYFGGTAVAAEPSGTETPETVSIPQRNTAETEFPVLLTDAHSGMLPLEGLDATDGVKDYSVSGACAKDGSLHEITPTQLAGSAASVSSEHHDNQSIAASSDFEDMSVSSNRSSSDHRSSIAGLTKMTSVRDHAQFFDQSRFAKSHHHHHHAIAKHKHRGHERGSDDVSSTASTNTLTQTEKQWLILSATCDYHGIAKTLQKHPELANFADFTSGHTALHWAARKGKVELIKLLAGTYHVDVNRKSHGGYTPMHLAAMHDHFDAISLLIDVYKADQNIRDNSGRKPQSYTNNQQNTRLVTARSLAAALKERNLSSTDSSRLSGSTLNRSHSSSRFSRLHTPFRYLLSGVGWSRRDAIGDINGSAATERIMYFDDTRTNFLTERRHGSQTSWRSLPTPSPLTPGSKLDQLRKTFGWNQSGAKNENSVTGDDSDAA